MNPLVIIPTYNEKENIERLVAEILKLNTSLHILIIDDHSPDGTGDIIERLSRQHPRIKVVHRDSKLGIGSAYICGFKYALDKGYEHIVTMDADLSHQPRFLLEFIKQIQHYDLIIGSRYINGGRIINWSLQRRLLSKYGNLIVKNLLDLEVNDSTSGFRGYNSGILKNVNFHNIHSDGYSFLIEILYRCVKLNCKIQELPIIFQDRLNGISKISRKEIIKAVAMLFKLKIREIAFKIK